jgi:hypothetical protein
MTRGKKALLYGGAAVAALLLFGGIANAADDEQPDDDDDDDDDTPDPLDPIVIDPNSVPCPPGQVRVQGVCVVPVSA